jgi:ketosteroid isomerase-like protein
MRKASTLIVAGLAAALATPAIASDKADVWAKVKAFDDTFNNGDTKGLIAACADDAIIIDDFAPHVWKGPGTCSNWLNALVAYNKAQGITDGVVTIGKPWHNIVTGDRAYVDVPAKYTYKQNGKPVVESGSNWTLAFQKVATGWTITGWSWAQH